jgi:hypothetical protein
MRPLLRGFAESNVSLWLIAASPALWAGHFMASYVFAALWCGRLGDDSMSAVRIGIAGFSVVALVGIVGVGSIGFSWIRAASGPPPHDADTAEDRRGFMGASMLLLSGLSGVGVTYSALAAVFIGTCT